MGDLTLVSSGHRRPKKAEYRQRATFSKDLRGFSSAAHVPQHDYPIQYEEPVVAELNGSSGRAPDFLDVGCGFGGLLVSLAPKFPEALIMGLEIREKVTNFVGERIRALRQEHQSDGLYENVSVIRTNATKFLLNYFRKAQVSKMFFCFPDPHFKRTNWRRRIINAPLLTLYAYIMKPGGRLYTATDVEEVHQWMLHALRRHPLFTELTEEEMKEDPCVAIIQSDTEESMKARREGRRAFTCVFTRL